MHARRAFSLLELITVLAIMGVMAAIAIPRYAESAVRYRAGAAAQRLEADLILARDRARLISQGITVTIDASAETVSIPAISGLDDPAVGYLTDFNEEPYKAAIISVSFGGAPDVTFDGFGVPDVGGIIVVRAGDVTINVTLDVLTGEVNLQ